MPKGWAAFVRAADRLGEAVDRFLGELPLPEPHPDRRLANTMAASVHEGVTRTSAEAEAATPEAAFTAAPALVAARRTMNGAPTDGNGLPGARADGTTAPGKTSNTARSDGRTTHAAGNATLAAWSRAANTRTTSRGRRA